MEQVLPRGWSQWYPLVNASNNVLFKGAITKCICGGDALSLSHLVNLIILLQLPSLNPQNSAWIPPWKKTWCKFEVNFVSGKSPTQEYLAKQHFMSFHVLGLYYPLQNSPPNLSFVFCSHSPDSHSLICTSDTHFCNESQVLVILRNEWIDLRFSHQHVYMNWTIQSINHCFLLLRSTFHHSFVMDVCMYVVGFDELIKVCPPTDWPPWWWMNIIIIWVS
jgi:hypothetical protein